jgi:hypothetical protein
MFSMALDTGRPMKGQQLKEWSKQGIELRREQYPFENHSLNCSWLSNSVGMMKCRSAHNSAILFCIGVPVRSKRFLQLKLSNVFQRWLQLRKEDNYETTSEPTVGI